MSGLAALILQRLGHGDWVSVPTLIRAEGRDHTNSEIRDAVHALVEEGLVEKRVEWHGRGAGGYVRAITACPP